MEFVKVDLEINSDSQQIEQIERINIKLVDPRCPQRGS